MFRRTFQANVPHITFTRDWRQVPFGNLVPGQTVHLRYDAARLPEERSSYNGVPTWSITAFYQFAPNGQVESTRLDMPGGEPPEPRSPDPTDAVFMTAAIPIPDDASELIMWFMNTGRSGRQFWDSDYGANYIFRFTSIDIQGEEANVSSDPATPYSGFNVSMTALLEVESPQVSYKVMNNPPENPFEGTIAMRAGDVANGRRAWAISGMAVPYQARIRFAFIYTVDGRTFTDDNDGTGFWAPKPLPTHSPTKFTAMVRAGGAAEA